MRINEKKSRAKGRKNARNEEEEEDNWKYKQTKRRKKKKKEGYESLRCQPPFKLYWVLGPWPERASECRMGWVDSQAKEGRK